MLTELCGYLHNYFCAEADKHFGNFKISGGGIAPPFLKEGQYFRIIGSTFNDGVYKFPTTELQDEEFSGAIWAMKVPPSFLSLVKRIEEFNAKEENKPSAYTSESFGGYSYSKATGKNGAAVTWKEVFAADLSRYRKIR